MAKKDYSKSAYIIQKLPDRRRSLMLTKAKASLCLQSRQRIIADPNPRRF
jgi:hypothetical protein